MVFIFISCENSRREKAIAHFPYEAFKDSLLKTNTDPLPDTADLFDSRNFDPAADSFTTLLIRIDTLWHLEQTQMENQDLLKKLSRTKEKYTYEDSVVIRENIRVLDSFLVKRDTINPGTCSGKDCTVFLEIVKSVQKLYLYIEGELKDSFLVSTGKKKYDTPDMDLSPRGPIFIKYKSKKFPGGNYQGLGNMPYAIFVKGGYAIHGTTQGNFARLGTKASHGCIRLHPVNAQILNELIKRIGLGNTWVRVVDTIP